MKALLLLLLAAIVPALGFASNGVERGSAAYVPLNSVVSKTAERIILREVSRRCAVKDSQEEYLRMYLDPQGTGVMPTVVFYRVHVQIRNKRTNRVDNVEVNASSMPGSGDVNIWSVNSRGRCR